MKIVRKVIVRILVLAAVIFIGYICSTDMIDPVLGLAIAFITVCVFTSSRFQGWFLDVLCDIL